MPVTINGSTGITGPDGSASTPSLAGADTNTGVFFPAADTVAIATGGAEAMRIDSSGNVGIGTSSPATPLNIYTAAARTDFRLSTGKSSGELAAFQCFGLNSSSASVGYAQIVAAASSSTAGSHSGYLAFETAVSGSLAERARIDTSGNLLVGTTSVSGLTTISANSNVKPLLGFLDTNTSSTTYRIVDFNRNGTQTGTISINNTNTTYATSSDYRLKEDVQPMVGGLARVAALKPVTYKWKVDGSDGEGFIAHELAEVVPQCVTGEKDAVDADGKPVYQGIDTSFLVATLTAAIQELNAKLDAQAAEIAALKGAA
jgi:hypothetical protein